MIEWALLSIAGLVVGGIGGFLIARGIAGARSAVVERQLLAVTEERDRERQKAQDASIAEATAISQKAAAVAEAARASIEEQTAKDRVDQLNNDLTRLREQKAELAARESALSEQIKAKDAQLDQQRSWFEERTGQLQALFENTATQLLQDRAEALGQQNNTQLDTLLAPFKQQLTEFRQRIDSIHSADDQARGELKNQIETLAKSALDVGSKADQLANAMLGNVKQQGEWGQLQLTLQLERAGFIEGIHFSNQYSSTNEDSERRIADTVLWLPNDNSLVIDAKVTLPSWKDFCSAVTEEERGLALGRMTSSIKAHYLGLAKKDYAHVVGKGRTIPFTIMFIPIEPAGLEVLRADPELFADACRRGVVMVTPTSLFGMLQLVSSLWSFQDKQKNALQIAEQGRLLLKKLNSFLDNFADVGNRISSAASTFEDAKRQLHTGRGNLISIAERMSGMGVEGPAEGELTRLMSEVIDEGQAQIISMPQLAASAAPATREIT